MARVDALVSVEWLKDQISRETPNLVILDTTWLPDHHSARDAYVKEHIRKAQFFDLDRGIKPTDTIPRNIPDQAEFQSYLQELGIDNDTHVVAYETMYFACATKTWTLFKLFGHDKVSVLDGGIIQWKMQGGDMASGDETSSKKGNFTATFNGKFLMDYKGIMDIVQKRKQNMPIVDARESVDFRGEGVEPSFSTELAYQCMNMPVPQTVKAGHIPGSVNIFRDSVWDKQTYKFLTKEELTKLFADVGVDIQKPFVTVCYVGMTASFLNFAAAICGNEDTSLYCGSWTEYGQLAPPGLVEKGSRL